jgi:hypothetical protein
MDLRGGVSAGSVSGTTGRQSISSLEAKQNIKNKKK